MSAIVTMPNGYNTIRIGERTYHGADAIPFRTWGAVVVAMVIAKLQKRRTRGHLAHLSQDQLRDVGLTHEQAVLEVRKSFPMYEPEQPLR